MKRIRTPLFWRRLPLARQLLLAVNSFLLLIVGGFLFFDHRLRVRHEVRQARVALTDEAKTLYESAIAIGRGNGDAVQKMVDSVCARMNSDDSPGHHIAAVAGTIAAGEIAWTGITRHVRCDDGGSSRARRRRTNG